MTVAQILQRSSNVGAITIAKMLGKDKLLHWIKRFGFGKPTGIDFPGESAGLLPGYWSGSTIGNVPIGQGISVTAIQLASVYAAIAHGGVWTQPHLVDHMQGEKPAAPKTRRIVSLRVDRELLKMLKGVVSDVVFPTAIDQTDAGIDVYTTMGICDVVLNICSRLNASKPPPPGIVMSRTIRSGRTWRTIIWACMGSKAEWIL